MSEFECWTNSTPALFWVSNSCVQVLVYGWIGDIRVLGFSFFLFCTQYVSFTSTGSVALVLFCASMIWQKGYKTLSCWFGTKYVLFIGQNVYKIIS